MMLQDRQELSARKDNLDPLDRCHKLLVLFAFKQAHQRVTQTFVQCTSLTLMFTGVCVYVHSFEKVLLSDFHFTIGVLNIAICFRETFWETYSLRNTDIYKDKTNTAPLPSPNFTILLCRMKGWSLDVT
jgi:hypothetical protein